MSNDDVATTALLEFLNGVEAGIVQAKRLIAQAKGVENPSWSAGRIKWVEAEGSKGPYDKATIDENKDNADFKALMKDLEAHNGKLTRDGFFFWKFDKSAVIGRKKRKG